MSNDEGIVYSNPLITRYARREMATLWSDSRRIGLWRRLWVALAEAERSLGLPIRESQIASMRAAVDSIDFGRAREYEKKLRHDVMAHVHAFGDAAPDARGIIHLGATSCFVTDNADLILIRDGLRMIRDDLARVISQLAEFASRWKDLPCLGYTHFQPAQLVTVGKRATLWCQDLVLDLEELETRIARLMFLGVKGTTGTQASFLSLFDGDHAKVEALDRAVATAFGFEHVYPVSGQTYPRKVDTQVIRALGGLGESAHRFGSDLRLLQHEGELAEPFESDQIGSSAMAYKRNPMRAERMCSLARLLSSLESPAAQTAATQWLERTLDDSAIRRMIIPQAFLAADAILALYRNVVPGLEVRPAVIARHVDEHIAEMATENILMSAVRAGGDRQELHERVRRHSMAAAERSRASGSVSDLADRIREDPAFRDVAGDGAFDPRRYCGRAPEQVEAFIERVVAPIRARYAELESESVEIDV